jgi:pyridoxal phosphate enzyme (YggS family)
MLTAPQFSPAALQSVRARIARAVAAAGRAPDSVKLVAVGKLQPVSMIRQAAAAGQVAFGENYVQEGCDKVAALADVPGLEWHFIGQLQGNKTREVAGHFHWVHTIDRARMAERLSSQRPDHLPPLQVLLQVRLADEPGKGGVAPADVPALASCSSGDLSGSCASCCSHCGRRARTSTPCRWA